MSLRKSLKALTRSSASLTGWRRSARPCSRCCYPPPAQQAFAKAALTYRFGEEHQPITEAQALNARRWQDESSDLWTVFNKLQENLVRGGLSGRTAQGKRSHTRAVNGIDGDLKLNRALWVMAEELQQALS